MYVVFGFLLIFAWQLSNANIGQEEIAFGELMDALEAGEIKDLTIKQTSSGRRFDGHYKEGEEAFYAMGVWDDRVHDALNAASTKGTEWRMAENEGPGPWMLLLNLLPILFFVALMIFFLRQVNATNGRAMSFGKSRAKLQDENERKKITFEDVAGADECKAELAEIVEFLKNPKKFTVLGGKIPKGVLLMGQPGTGKTLLARAVAGEAGVPFYSIAGSDFVEMFVGVGASRVRDLFEQAGRNAPCIIFIDEIDAVGRHRGAGMGGGHDEREQTLNQILVEMDGFEENEGLIVMAATNRPDVLDPAIMRPGRFDRRVVVPLPDVAGREAIFGVHTRKVPLGKDVDLSTLARATPGMSGADIANVVNEAALWAAQQNYKTVDMKAFETSRDKVMMGAERRSMVMSKNELENTAYHEAGHALVGILLDDEVDPVHKVTIIPRGRALGVTMQLPTDRMSYTKEYALNRIAILMGGRIAEELQFGKYTTGASNDIEQATQLARNMVCQWGMSEELGPLRYAGAEREVFLGKTYHQNDHVSESTAKLIDDEIRRIVNEQYARSEALLKSNMNFLENIAQSLLTYETLERDDLSKLMAGEALDRTPPKIRIKTREDVEAERALGQKTEGDRTSGGSIPLGGPIASTRTGEDDIS